MSTFNSLMLFIIKINRLKLKIITLSNITIFALILYYVCELWRGERGEAVLVSLGLRLQSTTPLSSPSFIKCICTAPWSRNKAKGQWVYFIKNIIFIVFDWKVYFQPCACQKNNYPFSNKHILFH